jgi:hypothetical protein
MGEVTDRDGPGMSEPRESDGDLDPGAYVGQRPELASERLPDGPQPGDQRVAAYDAAPGVPGEPDAPPAEDERTETDRPGQAGG